MIKHNSKNHFRKRIIDENLLQYIQYVKMTDRNKSIVTEYVSGSSYIELGRKHFVTPSRVRDIIRDYIHHCNLYKNKTRIYK